MPNNYKIWEFNFIDNNSKLKQDVNKEKKLKKENFKNYKCKMLKDKQDKEKSGKNKNNKECKEILEKICCRSLPDKTNYSKWPNKREEWNKYNIKEKFKDFGNKNFLLSEPKKNKNNNSSKRLSINKDGNNK